MQNSAIGARLLTFSSSWSPPFLNLHYHLSILCFAPSFPLDSLLSPLPTVIPQLRVFDLRTRTSFSSSGVIN
ncbi:unnamed protein product [Citrullus colocynthis]|uniref:Uncharacterized protein n=1 Tax=Citrullus colocynthis TaxID=252529 RepID=A0ABP0Y6U4_9ROSI